MEKSVAERRHILKELLNTEFGHSQDMIILDDIYRHSSYDILSDADRKILFGNLDDIRTLALKLVDSLKHAIVSVYVMPRQSLWNPQRGSFSTSPGDSDDARNDSVWTEMADEKRIALDRQTWVGQVFCANMHELANVYGCYLYNHPSANAKLAQLKINYKIDAWLQTCQNTATDLTAAWNLDSLLVKPTQRITKYPLILKGLLNVTAADHPDRRYIEHAIRDLEDMLHKWNQSRNYADIVDNILTETRKKDTEVRLQLTKTFVNRRAKKIKLHAGLSTVYEDADYDILSQSFGGHYFQIQLVQRDLQKYITQVENHMNLYAEFVQSSEVYYFSDDLQQNFPEEQSYFMAFAKAIRGIISVELPGHISALNKNVLTPIEKLCGLHENPQQLIRKRKKKIVEYGKWKSLIDKGKIPDKKLCEAAEQFKAVNEKLKEELPKLYALSSKLMRICLRNFIILQRSWSHVWVRKLKPIARDARSTNDFWLDLKRIQAEFTASFSFNQERIRDISLCNNSMIMMNSNSGLLSPADSSFEENRLKKRANTVNSSVHTTESVNSDFDSAQDIISTSRITTDESRLNYHSNPTPRCEFPNVPVSSNISIIAKDSIRSLTNASNLSDQLTQASENCLSRSTPNNVSPSAVTAVGVGDADIDIDNLTHIDDNPHAISHESNQLPASLNAASDDRLTSSSSLTLTLSKKSLAPLLRLSDTRSDPSYHHHNHNHPDDLKSACSSERQSFALIDTSEDGTEDLAVLFVAASLFEFRIEDTRTFVGFPYLQYCIGEIFDVMGQNGELWLARNQDDSQQRLGWIWEKHFARILPDS